MVHRPAAYAWGAVIALAAPLASTGSASAAHDCPVGVVQTVAGGGVGDGKPATQASLSPHGLAVAPDGSLYIADASNHRIRRIDPAGIITTLAGNGVGGYSGDGGPAAEASLHRPSSVALGADGSLYIADTGNHRIRKINRASIITTVAGCGSPRRQLDETGPATEATLRHPEGVAVGTNGELLVADTWNHRVCQVDDAGNIRTVAGGGTAGYSGDGGPAGEAKLNAPAGLAVGKDGSLYIADSGNHSVRRVDPAGIIATVFGDGPRESTHPPSGDADGSAARPALDHPTAVAIGVDGGLYIADAGHRRVCRVDPGGAVTTVAGNGERSYAGDGGPATAASLEWPRDIKVGVDGSLYVADSSNCRVRKVDPQGVIATLAGNGEWRFSGDGGPAIEAGLSEPADVAPGPDGSLYVADTYNHRVRKVGPGGIITTMAGSGERGYTGDGGPATEAALHSPAGVALGADGTLYIADTENHRVRKVDLAGIITTVAGNGTEIGYDLEEPADWEDVLERIRWLVMSGDGGFATEAMVPYPVGLAVGEDGSLYITQASRYHLVRKVSPAGIITTVAGVGVEGYAGDGGPATQAALRMPTGLALAADGSLYIADAGNHRIRKVDPRGVITTVAGDGWKDGEGYGRFAGDGGPAAEASLFLPIRLCLGAGGSIYIADSGSHRIRRVSPDGIIGTVAGTGLSGEESGGYSGDGDICTEARLNKPFGVAVGADGSLYIADTENDRVRRVCALGDPAAAKARVAAFDDPNSIEACETAARIYLLTQSWQEALAASRRLLAMIPPGEQPAHMAAELLSARAYAGMGDDREARGRLVRILARADDPKLVQQAAEALVDLHLRRHEDDRALATLRDLLVRGQDAGLQDWAERRLQVITEGRGPAVGAGRR